LIIWSITLAADCVVRPSWPDIIRAGSPDDAGQLRARSQSWSRPRRPVGAAPGACRALFSTRSRSRFALRPPGRGRLPGACCLPPAVMIPRLRDC